MYAILYIIAEVVAIVVLEEIAIWVVLGTGIVTLIAFFYAVLYSYDHEIAYKRLEKEVESLRDEVNKLKNES